ncbi:type II toxin-antitoxin system PemI/MazE family antitoxin [Enterococcus sp. LJL99]
MKTRKQGNAIVLTIPTKFGIQENVEYIAIMGEDESITFIKKTPNIFEQAFANNEKIDVGDSFPEDITGREML